DEGFQPLELQRFEGTVTENIQKNSQKRLKLQEEIDSILSEIKELAAEKPHIEDYQDILTIELDKKKTRSKLLKTKKTFYMEGWVPTPVVDNVAKVLTDEGCSFEFSDPAEGEEPPVLLETSKFASPFEAITEMYALPTYEGFDPTNIFSIFYAFFFGIMLSDAGYGLVLTIVCWIVLKKYAIEGTMQKLFKMFFTCGLFTIFWGVMFGGYFGDLFQVWASTVFGKTITIKPLWFNPMDDPTKLLIFSLLFGCVHLFVGMGIDMYMKIKRGDVADAILDQVPWYMVIIGAGCWLGGGAISPALTKPGMYLTIAGLVVLLFTGGRHSESIFGKITGGLSSVYGITGWISDILSYARLLALGLATGVIASVVNLLGSMIGTGFKGAVALIIIGLFGHIFSMAINVLGAFVHSSRLQYVEFFGKFYEDGGEPFKPFLRNTTYVKINDHK
ncbi:MAG: V-type ATP synthase subunit I, partial [Mogibacterium sp.]|nr:V-type ATP synthase subunit I [Mogibacterium sp.]